MARSAALRKIRDKGVVDDTAQVPKAAPLATAFWVNSRLAWASIPEAPAREPHSGACTCEACFAAWLADIGVEFD